MAAAERMLVAGFHFPFPSAGYVEKDGPRYRLIPVYWNPTLGGAVSGPRPIRDPVLRPVEARHGVCGPCFDGLSARVPDAEHLPPPQPNNARKLRTTWSGAVSGYSSGAPVRLIQTHWKPNALAAAMSQRLEDWKETSAGAQAKRLVTSA